MYVDGLIIRNGAPLMWQFDGGYVSLGANSVPQSWNYYITDHLGSTRMVVDSRNIIKETINYYPFGSEMTMTPPAQLTSNPNWQPYRFTGKELVRQNGLNMYDFGARWYDVAGVPVWTSMDPLCEKYYDVSPYAYCHNNPINMIDIDGKDDYFDEKGIFVSRTQDGSSVMVKSGEEYKNITEVDFSENRSVIGNIGRHYLAKSDKGSFSLSVSDTGGEGVPQNAAFSHTVNTNNYDLYLTNGYVNSSLGDYNNFECITYHESIHRYNANAGETTNGEIEAIIETTKCDAWNNATDGYIWSQASYAANKLNQLKGDPGLNNNLKRLNTAFRGYAAFKLLNDKVIVNNQIPSILCTGKLRK